MINSYLNDTINIVSNTYDEWGKVSSTSTQSNIKAYIEDYNKLIRDQEGKEVLGATLIYIDDSITIKYSDRITLKTMLGEAYQNPNKQFDIKNLRKVHGFESSHWEIII